MRCLYGSVPPAHAHVGARRCPVSTTTPPPPKGRTLLRHASRGGRSEIMKVGVPRPTTGSSQGTHGRARRGSR